jgi:hypothetical protein
MRGDLNGANVNVCIVRTDGAKGGKEGLSAILVPRGTPGLSFEAPVTGPAKTIRWCLRIVACPLKTSLQMRKIWGVMLDEGFDPRAFVDSQPIKFTKPMEGA